VLVACFSGVSTSRRCLLALQYVVVALVKGQFLRGYGMWPAVKWSKSAEAVAVKCPSILRQLALSGVRLQICLLAIYIVHACK
jgi:hypothetical protein